MTAKQFEHLFPRSGDLPIATTQTFRQIRHFLPLMMMVVCHAPILRALRHIRKPSALGRQCPAAAAINQDFGLPYSLDPCFNPRRAYALD